MSSVCPKCGVVNTHEVNNMTCDGCKLVEEKFTSTNNASTKLLARLHQMVLQSPLAAGYAMSDLIKEVREQLRASGE